MKFTVPPPYRWRDITRRIRTLYDSRRLRRRREIFHINLVTFTILTTTNDPAEASTAVLTMFERPADTQGQIAPRANSAGKLDQTIISGQVDAIDVACDGVGPS